jgi:predicted metalloprotease
MIGQLSPASTTSPFRAEQFADYMAGYYAGRRKLDDSDFPAVIFAHTTSLYGGGDHGTADQRGNAVQEGFLCAYYRKSEAIDAAQRALSFSLGADA